MEKQKKYMVTNTTVKAPKVDKATGKDLRRAVERVGHAVQWRDSANNIIAVFPNGNPQIVGELSGGLLKLHQAGLVRVDEVDDVMTALKKHALPTKKGSAPAAKSEPTKAETPAPEPVKVEQPASQPERPKASAVEMGKDTYGEGKPSSSEYPGAVNPDGDPSFVVKAGRKRGRRGEEQTTDTSDNNTEG